MKEGQPEYYKLLAKNSPDRKKQPLVNSDGKYYIHPLSRMGEYERGWLIDSEQPKRSIFNFGDSRHELFGSKEKIQEQNELAKEGKGKFIGNQVVTA